MYVRQNLFDCTNTRIIVSILEYKYIYNCMYPCLIKRQYRIITHIQIITINIFVRIYYLSSNVID